MGGRERGREGERSGSYGQTRAFQIRDAPQTCTVAPSLKALCPKQTQTSMDALQTLDISTLISKFRIVGAQTIHESHYILPGDSRCPSNV